MWLICATFLYNKLSVLPAHQSTNSTIVLKTVDKTAGAGNLMDPVAVTLSSCAETSCFFPELRVFI